MLERAHHFCIEVAERSFPEVAIVFLERLAEEVLLDRLQILEYAKLHAVQLHTRVTHSTCWAAGFAKKIKRQVLAHVHGVLLVVLQG